MLQKENLKQQNNQKQPIQKLWMCTSTYEILHRGEAMAILHCVQQIYNFKYSVLGFKSLPG